MNRLEEIKISLRQKQTNINNSFNQLFDKIESAEVELSNQEKLDQLRDFISANASHIDPDNCSDYEEGYYNACYDLLKHVTYEPLEELLIDR